ncbi:uncharacterized protein CDAR_269221 [Caerostris darwini]|uniref:Uncharacterized protein n=1 Tax=Caerostris darwini TaxID=1538125 RepID=A0AAV4NTI1_9ARAC|nr:uncharacterized protein CDAR_269221 [Caerostris darwini]
MRVSLGVAVVLLSGVVLGEQWKKKACPPVSVDCSCTEKDDDMFTIQMNVTTTSIVDEDSGLERCIAEEDALSVCERRNCVIIPNDNFEILFQKGRKVSPSNFLKEDDFSLDEENSHPVVNKTDKKNDQRILDAVLSPFFPVELTYPRMVYEEDSEQRVRRNAESDEDEDEDDGEKMLPLKHDDPVESSVQGNQSYRRGYYGRSFFERPPSGYRFSNYYKTCSVPQMKNSEVTCWRWPNWQSCKQSCIYGHGMQSRRGTVRSFSYTCRHSENQWKPHKMTDCQAYLNCKVHLTSPGDLKCVEPTNQAPYCDISCQEYDSQPAKKVRVICDEQKGRINLPHCATLDERDMNLRQLWTDILQELLVANNILFSSFTE